MTPFLLALQFLTAVTLRRELDVAPGDLARARAWFGLVGVLLGGALAIFAWALARLLPPLALAPVLVLAWAASTRFLHLDGVADVADALVYTTSRERALAIMKDSRTGAFGVAGLALVLLLKFGALASLSGPALYLAPLAAAPLGRALAAALSVLLPPATPGSGLGADCGAGAGAAALLASAACAVAAAWLAVGAAGLWAALAVLFLGLLLGLWYRRRLGGVTGDCLGAAIELAEAVALLTLVAA